jgi:hypothetical protein
MPEDVAFVGDEQEAIALYLDLRPKELVDLEVAAATAIEWARSIKAAAVAVDANYDYRVSLIAAEPGSCKWLAKLERAKTAIESSKANQRPERIKAGWESMPLIMRIAIGLAVVVPVTAVPTIEYWFDSEDFSPNEFRK